MNLNAQIKKKVRQFLPKGFEITDWKSLETFFIDLEKREILSVTEFEKWIANLNELKAVISEDACWRQIQMTRDTENKTLEDAFTFFCIEIEPHIKPYAFRLNKKIIESPFIEEVEKEKYAIYFRSVKNEIALFNEKNIAIEADINILAQQYGAISGKMSVEVDGKEFTLQQAATFLQLPDREKRKDVYFKIATRRAKDKNELNELFNKLLSKRHEIAVNAGFDNFRDYQFQALGRFDYSVKDCEAFHESIKKYMLPIVEKIYENKKKELKLDTLYPWDLDAVSENETPLRPFENGDDLMKKSISTFTDLHPFLGNCLSEMQERKHVDLDSRKGKAPGGYNCPLAETGVPFIFMNAASTADDVITMMHEGGHAVHSFLSHELELSAFQEYPMEMAELASMSMELFSMEHWQHFYNTETDLLKAKKEELERVLTIFPWIATIDKFQHWLYTNPLHTEAERTENWMKILNEFYPKNIEVEALESIREIMWQKQLHLFEVPFYYIEYGIAQLGAIGMWKNFQENKIQTLENYMQALSLGYTKPLNKLYEIAGIKFDFSEASVKELASFVEKEMEKYN